MNETVRRQHRHYEAIARTYVESRRQSAAYSAFLALWAQRLLAPWLERNSVEDRRRQVVLDPMCGHGNLAPYILQHTEYLVLNDLSPAMVAQIDEEIRRRSRVLPPSDAANLPLDGDSVEVVVISGGLHHVHRTLSSVLQEFRRVLRPGGMVLFGEPSNRFLPVRVLRDLVYRFNRSFDHRTERAFCHHELRTALLRAGFAEVQIEPFGSIGYLLMAQVGVLPFLRSSKNHDLFQVLQAVDGFVESAPLLRRSCFALTGSAVKPADAQ